MGERLAPGASDTAAIGCRDVCRRDLRSHRPASHDGAPAPRPRRRAPRTTCSPPRLYSYPTAPTIPTAMYVRMWSYMCTHITNIRCMQNCTPKTRQRACIAPHRTAGAPRARPPCGPAHVPALRGLPAWRLSRSGGHRVRAAVKRERRRLYLFFLGGDVVNSYLSRGVSNARRDRDRDRGALSKHTHVGARGALAARLPWSDIGCSVFGVRTPTQLEGTPTTLGVRGAFKNTHM